MLLPRIGNSYTITEDIVASWPKLNNVDPVTRTWLTPFSIVLLSISAVLVFIRLGLRIAKKGGGLGLDDAFLVPSFLILVAYTTLAVISIREGTLDRHVWDIDPTKYVIGQKLGWWLTILFNMGTCTLKLSILFFYRRLIAGTYNRPWLFATWIAIGFTICYNLAFILGMIFTCTPIEAYWLSSDHFWAATNNYRCFTWIWGNTLSGIFNAVSNLYSVVLPALVLWNLQLPRRQKIGLHAIFTLGGIDVVLSCVRASIMYDYSTKYDPSWYGYDATAVAVAEWNVGLLCACAPSLRVLFRTYFDPSRSRTGASSPPRYVKPRALNRIKSTDSSELPLASCKGEPEWIEGRGRVEMTSVKQGYNGIVRTREYDVAV